MLHLLGEIFKLRTSLTTLFITIGIDRTIKCWKLEDRKRSDPIDEPSLKEASTVATESGDNCVAEGPSKTDKKKKNKKKNKRFAGNSHPMQFSLLWDEDHVEKVNVIGGFRVPEGGLRSDKIFVGDNSSNLTIYTTEGGY